MNIEMQHPEGATINWTELFNSNDFEKVQEETKGPVTAVSAIIICIIAIGLLANAALMFALLRGGKYAAIHKVPSTILIINLVIADSLLLLTLPFAVTQRFENSWRFGAAFCKIEESLKYLSYYASVFFLTAMAGDRYFSIFWSKNYDRTRARRKLSITSICIWLLALLAVIPIAVFSNLDHQNHCTIIFPGTEIPNELQSYNDFESSSKSIDWSYETTNTNYLLDGNADSNYLMDMQLDEFLKPAKSNQEIIGEIKISSLEENGNILHLSYVDDYQCTHPEAESVVVWLSSNFAVGFALPFIVIFFCYFKILLLKANSSSSQSSGNCDASSSSSSSDKAQSSSRKTKSFTIFNRRTKKTLDILFPCLILAFLICWLPYHVWHFVKINGVSVSRVACNWITDVTFILAYANSALNPILNSFFLFNFKKQFGKSAIWLKKLTHLTGTNVNTNVRFEKDLEATDKSCGNVTFLTNAVQNANEVQKGLPL